MEAFLALRGWLSPYAISISSGSYISIVNTSVCTISLYVNVISALTLPDEIALIFPFSSRVAQSGFRFDEFHLYSSLYPGLTEL